MGLMNTVSNLGGTWPGMVSLWVVDRISSFDCLGPVNSTSIENWNEKNLRDTCKESGGVFKTTRDGYYYEVFGCILMGILWYKTFSSILDRMDEKPKKSWQVKTKKNSEYHASDNAAFSI